MLYSEFQKLTKNRCTVEEYKKVNSLYECGDVLEEEVYTKDFGRIAAQTAKQVVVQRIRIDRPPRALVAPLAVEDRTLLRRGDLVIREVDRPLLDRDGTERDRR